MIRVNFVPMKTTASRQRGAATLLVAGVLLFIITLVSIFTANTVMVEKQITANQQREVQAFNSAQSGLDFLLARLNEESAQVFEAAFEAGGVFPVPNGVTGPADCGGHEVRIESIDGGFLNARATGVSDDCVGRRTVWQRIARGSGNLPGDDTPPPLVSRGSPAGQSAAHSIVNPEFNLTVWSGEDWDPVNSSTYISDPADPCVFNNPSYQLQDCSLNPGQRDPNQGRTIQDSSLSVVANDDNLASLTPAEMFALLFAPDAAADSEQFWRNWTEDEVEGFRAQNFTRFGTDIPPDGTDGFLDLVGRFALDQNAYWVDVPEGEELRFTGNVTIGCSEGVGPSEECGRDSHEGTESPKIVVIDGDAYFSAGTVINGLVFVRGNASGAGGARIYGSLVIGGKGDKEGSWNGTGNLDIYYSSSTLAGSLLNVDDATVVPGTWRDFELQAGS